MRSFLALVLMSFCPPLACAQTSDPADRSEHGNQLFAKSNLVAWCIVPFDSQKRNSEERAQMLTELGITKLAYDYRSEHIPTFEAELDSLNKHGIELTAWWFPRELNAEAELILSLLAKRKLQTQLWVTGGGSLVNDAAAQKQRVAEEAARIRPIAEAASKIGCQVGLYNHGGWFGEPENQVQVIEELGMPNVGIVYNLHHGHEQMDRLGAILDLIGPRLLALNLNGMVTDGPSKGQKILPIGAGSLDLSLLRVIRDSGYTGPIGILNHTNEDAKLRLQDNLNGLAWLVQRLGGDDSQPRPTYRSFQ